MKKLPATVVALGLASLFTDLSSEMIFPLLPIFLAETLGAGAIALGLVEGVANSTAALLKLASGYWTDRVRRRKPFVLAGYGIAGAARPLIGLASSWPWVAVLRFSDRVGKGLRGAPRDALIAESIEPDRRGVAFGYHRAMDHAGAALGPLAAAGLLLWTDLSLRGVFLAAAIPAVAAFLLIAFRVRDADQAPRPATRRTSPPPARLDRRFRWYLVSLGLFSLGAASDAFLLLALSLAGLSPAAVAGMWAIHNIVKMGASLLAGHWSDRAGRRAPILLGWLAHGLIFAAFAWFESLTPLAILFVAYGAVQGVIEPAEMALVADLAPRDRSGAAFGWRHMVAGVAALPASLAFGLLWDQLGASAAFWFGAALAGAASVGFAALPRQ